MLWRLATPDISHLLTSYTWWNHLPQVDPPADRSRQHLRWGTTSIALPPHLRSLGIVNPVDIADHWFECPETVTSCHLYHWFWRGRTYQLDDQFQKWCQGRLTSSYKPEQSKKPLLTHLKQSWWENKEKCAIWSGEGCIHLADRCSSVKEWLAITKSDFRDAIALFGTDGFLPVHLSLVPAISHFQSSMHWAVPKRRFQCTGRMRYMASPLEF